MPSYFLDSSALVKGYRREIGTARIHQLLRGPDPLVISELSHLEVSSAIVRRAGQAKTAEPDVRNVLDELDREVSQSLEVIPIDHLEIASAIRLARKHQLRGADAIQLAAAINARGGRPQQEFIFISGDLELNAAATAEGLAVENPNSHQ